MAEQRDTISQGQLEALRAGIRAAAGANPAGGDKGQRCAEFTRTVCNSFGVGRLAELPASSFTQAMQAVAKLAVPVRQAGEAEASLKAAGARLDAALSSILQARRDVVAYRHEAEGVLLPRLRDALGSLPSDAFGILLTGQLLDIEDSLRKAHETLHILAVRLPHIGRGLDERRPAPAMLGAD